MCVLRDLVTSGRRCGTRVPRKPVRPGSSLRSPLWSCSCTQWSAASPPPPPKMRTIAETVNLAKTSMPRIPPTPPSHTHRPRDRFPLRASQVYGPPPAAASGRRLWREEQEEQVRLGGGRGEIQSNAFESSWGCPVFF